MQISTLYEFVDIINDYYNLKLINKSRLRVQVKARNMFYLFARKYTRFSFAQIGSITLKNHATVIHGIRTIENDIKYDKSIAHEYNELQAKLSHFNSKDKVFFVMPVEDDIQYLFRELRDEARLRFLNVYNLKPLFVLLPNKQLYLIHTLDAMLQCKTVILFKGWQNCEICKIQVTYAKYKNISIQEEI